MTLPRVVIADSEVVNLRLWASWIEAAGVTTRRCETPGQVEALVGEESSVVLLGIRMADAGSWLSLVRRLRARPYPLRIVVLAVESCEELAIEALRAGVEDYLRVPITAHALVTAIRSTDGRRRTPDDGTSPSGEHALLGNSQAMQNLRNRLRRLASADSNVLITGETGTGKELAAAAIHRNSARRHDRFICVNCAAIPDTLVESELFGHERGAFTGAETIRDGKLKAADGGVIFLDEVGDLSPYAQAKILRAVETKEVYRLGGQRPISVNVRIVAATHRNLEDMVAAGRFRQDLFFRLNVGRVHIVPLRERREDLALLIRHYLDQLNRQLGTSIEGFSEAASERLIQYSWPGNVRELKNLVESVLVNSDSRVISVDDLPAHFRPTLEVHSERGERDELVQALLATKWNKTKAAERLHWSRMTLYRKMAKYAISGSTSDQVA